MDFHELQQRIWSREALESELDRLHQKADELSARLRREKVNLEYEQSDVKALEENTLKALFLTAIGKKEERLMKEEDEAEEALRQKEAKIGLVGRYAAQRDRAAALAGDLQELLPLTEGRARELAERIGRGIEELQHGI